jgi:hypothetical protein
MSNIIDTTEYRENILTLLMDNDEVTVGNGITIKKLTNMEDEFKLRLIVPMELLDNDDNHRSVFFLAYDLISTMLSETTNNDQCRITLTETSAHFDVHDLREYAELPFASVVVIDAEINDYLS